MEKTFWNKISALFLAITLAFSFTLGCVASDEEEPVSLIITDDSSDYLDIWYVYIVSSPQGYNGSWGSDQLGDTEIISYGSSRTFTKDPNTYDIRIETEPYWSYYYGDYVYDWYETYDEDCNEEGESYYFTLY